MRNKSEKPQLRTYEVRAVRYVREEASFQVEASSKAEADRLVDDMLDLSMEDLEWEADYDYAPDVECDITDAGPATPLKPVSKDEFSRYAQIMFDRVHTAQSLKRKP